MRKILCFFGIHKFGLVKGYKNNKPYIDCEYCSKWRPLEMNNIPEKYIPIRNIENGDKIKLVQCPDRYNGLSNCMDKNAFEGYTGIVDLKNKHFILYGETSSLICGSEPIRIYEMDGMIFKF